VSGGASVLRKVAGPASALGLVLLLLLFEHIGVRIPNPVLLFALSIVLSAFLGGIPIGLASVAITFAFTAVYWSIPGRPFRYAPQDAQRLLVQALTMPAMALLVGRLRWLADRRSRSLAEALGRERELNAALTAALGEVKQLEGLVPICAYCKSVRDDDGYWERIEAFVASRTKATFTHGICPACARRLVGPEDPPAG